jgi:putative tricarboxylic transport membrane protein
MKTDKFIVLATVLLAAFYWFATEQIKEPLIGDPIGPKAIPRLLIIGLLIAAVLLWLETLAEAKAKAKARAQATNKAFAGKTSPQEAPAGAKGYLFIAAMVLSTLGYFFLFNWLGYALATALYLYTLMAIFNPGKTRANALTAAGFSFGSYLAFTRLFGAQIPAGLLPF